MKLRSYVLLLSCCTAAFSGQVRADDFGQQLAGGLIHDISTVLLGGLKKEMDAKISEEHAMTDRGFCQVWRSGQLAVQRPCEVKLYCETDGSCTSKFRWPNGNFSEVVFKDQVPVSLNGHPTGLALVGSDQCAQDGATSVFCFTPKAQMAGQAVTIAPASFPSQGTAQVGANQIQVTSPQNGLGGENVPLQGSAPQPTPTSLPAPSQGSSDGITEVDIPAQAAGARSSSTAETLLAQYVVALQNDATDPQAKVKRCALGPALLTVYRNDLDQETKDTLQAQMTQDGCS